MKNDIATDSIFSKIIKQGCYGEQFCCTWCENYLESTKRTIDKDNTKEIDRLQWNIEYLEIVTTFPYVIFSIHYTCMDCSLK